MPDTKSVIVYLKALLKDTISDEGNDSDLAKHITEVIDYLEYTVD